MIPKVIYTCWFSEDANIGIPQNIQKCIDSQKKMTRAGYEHILLTLDNINIDHEYVRQCINSPHKKQKWTKLKDFVQYYYLFSYGGWFLDADVEVFPSKTFDKYENENFVIGVEGNGTIPGSIILGSAVIGSSKGNPILAETLDKVISQFRGDDDKCYESSLDILTPICLNNQDKICITQPDVFYPYNHETGRTIITDASLTMHKFTKSWILPTISFILPHLDIGGTRAKGLQDCIDSIKALDYPQNLIDIYVINGDETVPQKVKRGVNETSGEYIVYAANDMTFHKDSVRIAIDHSLKNNKALVSFNEGPLLPDKGNINTHFLIRRDFLPYIGGEIFSTELTHVGVDNLLWAKAEALNECEWCEQAKITHNHFSKTGVMDEVYMKGWSNVDGDRAKLNYRKAIYLQEVIKSFGKPSPELIKHIKDNKDYLARRKEQHLKDMA